MKEIGVLFFVQGNCWLLKELARNFLF